MTKQENDFLINTLFPIGLDDLQNSEHKSKFQLFLHAHNPESLTPFDDILNSRNLTKEQYFYQAYKDTLEIFFLEKGIENQKQYFSITSFDDLKDNFLELFEYNRFYNYKKRIFAVEFYIFLKHLYETFETLESYDQASRFSQGTAFLTSDYRKGLDHPIKELRDSLDPNKNFPLVFENEKKKVQVNLFCIKAFRNHLDITNMMLICNAMHNIDDLKIDFTDGEKVGFKQSFSFLNGLKTSKRELIQSFMIKTYFPYYRKNKVNKTKLAKFTHHIAEKFFPDIVYPREGTGQYTIGLSARAFNYKLYIKTALLENIIYAYDHKNEYTFLIKGSITDALKFVKKMYLDEGHDEIVNHPLFDQTMRKVLINPIYPI
ncbi:MAG: hypothetical protein PHI47_08295 [Sulfuricurvum sp.]|uniref:hypothetical protein n=1 Tax=Sulfuricurvum sp. TaxID=2025608 RepID=UPI002632B95B|nr:hypothetical protein [Sulfuricurvum sp.]MDD5160034.1 hypothetical protein [Sulfuricurvum sp.]